MPATYSDRERRDIGGRAEQTIAPCLGERAQRRIFVLDRLLLPMLAGQVTADEAATRTQVKLTRILEATP